MTLTILSIIAGFVTIIGVYIKWRLDPARIDQEIDNLDRRIRDVEGDRDEALRENDTDNLTIATHKLSELRNRKTLLLQRRRQNSSK